MRLTPAIFFAIAPAACFSPEFADGTIACGEAGCPSGMVCATDGYCYSTPPTSDADRRVALAVASSDGNIRLYAYCSDALTLVWTDDVVRSSLAAAWGDPDEDGVPDLAIAADDNGVRLFGLGSDGPWHRSSEPVPGARDVAFGRFDDGHPDLAVASAEGFRVIALRDDWFEEVWRSGPHDGLAVAVADFDEDGFDDLAAGTRGESVGVYRSTGDGLEGMWWDNPGDAERVAWGDQDDDGDPDIVTSASGFRVHANRGDYFEGVLDVDVAATAVAWGNFDGDGDDDLAVGTEQTSSVIVYRNVGGELEQAWASDETDASTSVDWGDMDGDGDLDLAVGSDWAPARVYKNDGGQLELAWSSDEVDATSDVAWADWTDGPDPCAW